MRDPFDQRAHFDTFGFVVLRGALTGSEVTRLRDEGDRTIRDATGDNYRVDIGLGGMTGHYIPATGERTPASVDLLQRFAPMAEQLLGRPHVISSRPGDVIVFDEKLWHASVDGQYRLQWSTSYVIDPVTSDDDAQVAEYLRGQFVPGMKLDYDPAHYPHFGGLFRAVCPPRWVTQLDRLGALAAAAAEQRTSS